MSSVTTLTSALRKQGKYVADIFNECFLDLDEAFYGPGAQLSDAVPLFLGLVSDEQVDHVAANLTEKVRPDGGS